MASGGFSPGDVLRGKYRIKRVLGEGGMGVVVRATHLRLEQDVAIKMLRDEGAAKPHVVERFAREARAAARLRGEHAVRILDVDDQGGAPFLVMEYLDGSDLDRLVRRDGRLAMERAVDYLLQACAGLAEAHALGIVHRDVKPANIFLAKTPRGGEIVKILDFGISKALDERDPTITDGDRVLGSPAFMSPEQLKAAREVDPRSDVWSLGVVLHFLLSGELPFAGDSATAVAARIASEAPVELTELRPELPAELSAVVLRCLAKERDGRYASVAELAHALAPFAEGGATAAHRVSSVLRMPVAASASSAASGISRAAGPATVSLEAEPSLQPDRLTASLDAPGPVSLGLLPVAGEESVDAPPREDVAPRSRRLHVTLGVLVVAGGIAWLVTRGGSDAKPIGGAEIGSASGTIAPTGERGVAAVSTMAIVAPVASASADASANANAGARADANANANASANASAMANADAAARLAVVVPRVDAGSAPRAADAGARPAATDDPLRLDIK
ncbi:MAG: Protein kinase [Myxococcaceae bacterium]|nr:Protein kinase [Myxococcaceae bacterium]